MPERYGVIVSDGLMHKSGQYTVSWITPTPVPDMQPTHVRTSAMRKPAIIMCEKLTTVYAATIGKKVVGCLSDDEMHAVDKALAVALGIDALSKAELREARIERDIYKRLYDDTLALLLSSPKRR